MCICLIDNLDATERKQDEFRLEDDILIEEVMHDQVERSGQWSSLLGEELTYDMSTHTGNNDPNEA